MDVIGSGIEACPWGVTGYGFEAYAAETPANIVAALARYWADYTEAITVAEEQFAASCLRIRYEDLVDDPEAEAGRVFEFAGVEPVPGIASSCLTPERQRFGPGDYKIWNTTQVTTGSVGRGWQVPARLIPAPLLARVNDLADSLGYVRVDEKWGIASRPADLRVHPETPQPDPARAEAGGGAAPMPPGARLLGDRVQAGLARLGKAFTRVWHSSSTGSVLLFATGPAQADADAWWRLDLGAGTVTTGAVNHAPDADWSVTGSAQAWGQVLSGDTNLGVAFRHGQLRYAGNGDAAAGSAAADHRVAMMADLLGITRWQPARTSAGPATPGGPATRSPAAPALRSP